ncbi:MAG: DedA family protein [Hahellaceae bacterium]|jgi:membrane protein YqaA with SNARE-associated domain|nr:DedA family protein [Hahellaceae bacterium]MCP5210856.1 DedA family protein [Hahellaceae bacterium]
MEYLAVFASSFVAATLLPMYSEVVLGTLIINGFHPLFLWIAATTGNTLGAIVNWLLGRYLLHWQNHRWFPFKAQQLDKATRQFNRFGIWSLLFAWLPVIGDPLTLIAGLLRVKFWLFVILVGIGKGLRYAAVVYLVT